MIRIRWRCTRCARINFLRQDFRNLLSDRQTERQTPSKLYTTPLRGWSTTANTETEHSSGARQTSHSTVTLTADQDVQTVK